MQRPSAAITNLYFINDIHSSAQNLKIQLQNGKVVTLSRLNKSYEGFVEKIIGASKSKFPIGLTISADNEIIDIRYADNDFVMEIASKNNNTFVIQFQGHDGYFFLHHGDPKFEEIFDVLKKAKIGSKRVWFIAQLPQLTILDVIPTR